ncbi:MAG: aldose epimerase [Bacteroidetes bacterium]|nr:MAG: aldose epimerase [Bacteroidota bacterium]
MLDEFSIKNEYLEIRVKRKGAELCSVINNNGTEFIWQAGDVWPRHAPNLFPIVGSLLDHQYIYENQTYSMNHHGFARDTDFDMLHQSEHSICFVLKHNIDTLKSYPFKFTLLITYRLEDNILKQIYRIINDDIKAIPASIGGHPAFNADPIEDYELHFSKNEHVRSNQLSGPYINNQELEVINGNTIRLDNEIFDHDALIFQGLRSNHVTLQHKTSGYSIKVKIKDFPYLGIWSKPSAPFVCLEPWQGLADYASHNKQINDKKGIIKIPKGDDLEKSFTMEFNS